MAFLLFGALLREFKNLSEFANINKNYKICMCLYVSMLDHKIFVLGFDKFCSKR